MYISQRNKIWNYNDSYFFLLRFSRIKRGNKREIRQISKEILIYMIVVFLWFLSIASFNVYFTHFYNVQHYRVKYQNCYIKYMYTYNIIKVYNLGASHHTSFLSTKYLFLAIWISLILRRTIPAGLFQRVLYLT